MEVRDKGELQPCWWSAVMPLLAAAALARRTTPGPKSTR
jgi:hypothetical protein